MKIISSLSILLFLGLVACHSNHSSTQKSNNSSFSSIQTGKTDMPTKSAMVNEILITRSVPPDEFKDASSIVNKYIPTGTSRVLDTLFANTLIYYLYTIIIVDLSCFNFKRL